MKHLKLFKKSPWNNQNNQDKNPANVNEYDPLNPNTNSLQNPPLNNFPEGAKSGPQASGKPYHSKNYNQQYKMNLPLDPAKDLSKMLVERNSKKDQVNESTPVKTQKDFTNSDEKNKKTNPSPRKSEKKQIRDTVYIKNIPNYYNSVETLSKFYKKFGSIENIQVEQSKLLASVKFMKAIDAVKAVNSNKKLFGKDDIFVTLNPDEEPPKKTNNRNPQNNENKNVSNNVPYFEKKEVAEKKEDYSHEKDLKKAKPVNSLLEGKLNKFQEMKNKKEKETLKAMIKKKLANKLKFLLYLKNRIEKTELKNELTNEINKLKNYKNEIDKGNHDENIKEIHDKEMEDISFDYTLNLNNLPENLLNYSLLQSKLEVNFFLKMR